MRFRANAAACTLAALLSLASGVHSADAESQPTACTGTYTIAAGDTCDSIGQKTLTSTFQIMALNLPEAGPNCHELTPGHTICLGRYGSDCQTVYRAESSDTCSSIAAAYGISVSLLQHNNPTLDCNQVYNGLVLCTAPGNVHPVQPKGLNSTYLLYGRSLDGSRTGSAPQAHVNVARAPGQGHGHAPHRKTSF